MYIVEEKEDLFRREKNIGIKDFFLFLSERAGIFPSYRNINSVAHKMRLLSEML